MDFWETVFPVGQTGYVYVARINGKEIDRKWINLETQRETLPRLASAGNKGNLYFCPSVFKEKGRATKDNVLGSWCAWIDHDTASAGKFIPEPNLLVASGSKGRHHAYWKSEEFLSPVETELLNEGLVKTNSADPSGIDCTQLLRVPGSINHKTGAKVAVLSTSDSIKLLEPAQHTSLKVTECSLLDINSLLVEHPIPSTVQDLFLHGREGYDRSNTLYYLGALLHEKDYTADQIYTLLWHADATWGKFAARDDKALRLEELVRRVQLRTKRKPPNKGPVGWASLKTVTHGVVWVVENVLREKGLMYFTGPTSIGKSTAVMGLCAKIALGADNWAGFKITKTRPEKILYGSHEMDADEVLYFTSHLEQALPEESVALLEQRFHFMATGTAVYLDTAEGREQYESLFRTGSYTGLVLDTLGASVTGSLQGEETVRPVVDWLDRMRQEYGVWVIVLHHPRKTQNGSKKASTGTDDLYGSRILIDRANTALHLDKTPAQDILSLTSLKSRLSPQNAPVLLRRLPSLWMEVITQAPTPVDVPRVEKVEKVEEPMEFSIDI